MKVSWPGGPEPAEPGASCISLPTLPTPIFRLSCGNTSKIIDLKTRDLNMSNLPDDLKYAKSHEWAKLETDGTVRVGISDFAQEQLGDVVYVELPQTGRKVKAGEAVAVVESVKAASDIYSPVSGEIVAANETLADAPESINQDAYGAWMFSVKPDNPAELDALLDAEGYRESAGA
jgi:glycine cleavage system H protein